MLPGVENTLVLSLLIVQKLCYTTKSHTLPPVIQLPIQISGPDKYFLVCWTPC